MPEFLPTMPATQTEFGNDGTVTFSGPGNYRIQLGTCLCGGYTERQEDPQYGEIWKCASCGQEYVDD